MGLLRGPVGNFPLRFCRRYDEGLGFGDLSASLGAEDGPFVRYLEARGTF